MVPLQSMISEINKHLPEQIRVIGKFIEIMIIIFYSFKEGCKRL